MPALSAREDPAPPGAGRRAGHLDDRRIALALDALAELGRERQILLFTCQEREGNYLEGRPGVTRTALRGGRRMRGAMAEKEPGRGCSEWLQTLMTAVVCIVLLFTFVGRVVRVDGRSMDPALAHGELLLVWSMGYEPRAGDIVIASKTTAEPLEGRPSSSGPWLWRADGGAGLRGGPGTGGRTGPGGALPSGAHGPAPKAGDVGDAVPGGGGFPVPAGGQPQRLHRQPAQRGGQRAPGLPAGPGGGGDLASGPPPAAVTGISLAIPAGSRYNKRPINTVRSARRSGRSLPMSEEFEARAGAPQQSPQEGAEEQEKLPQEELFYWLQTLVTAIVCIVLVFTFLGRITRVVGHSMDDTLADGELLAVWSLGYEPEQGDIVVLNKTTADFLEGRPSSSGSSPWRDRRWTSTTTRAQWRWTDRCWTSPIFWRRCCGPPPATCRGDPLRGAGGLHFRHGRQPQRLHRQPARVAGRH